MKIFFTLLFLVLVGVSDSAIGQGWDQQYPIDATDILPDANVYTGSTGALSFNKNAGGAALCWYADENFVTQYRLVRFSAEGEHLWTQEISPMSAYYFQTVLVQDDGSTILGGYYHSWSANDTGHYILIKYNFNGESTDTGKVSLQSITNYWAIFNSPFFARSSILAKQGGILVDLYYQKGTVVPLADTVNEVSVTAALAFDLSLVWEHHFSTTITYPDSAYYNQYNFHYPYMVREPLSTVVTADGGFARLEYTGNPDSSYNYSTLNLVKYNSGGMQEWATDASMLFDDTSTSYPAEYTAQNSQLMALGDSGLIFACKSYSTYLNSPRSHYLRYSKTGQLVNSFETEYVTSGNYLQRAFLTSNGKIFAAVDDSLDQGIIVQFDSNLTFLGTELDTDPSMFYNMDNVVTDQNGGGISSIIMGDSATSQYWIRIVRFDSLFNTYPTQLSGNLTYDLNTNCAVNPTDLPFQNKVTTFTNSAGQQWYGLSDAVGHYKRSLPYGGFAITTTPEPNKQVNCPAAGSYSVVLSTPGEQSGNDFYKSLIPGLVNLSVSAVPATFIPGFDATPHFLIKNNGSQPFSGELKIVGDRLWITSRLFRPAPSAATPFPSL